jgi:hypothetical protein
MYGFLFFSACVMDAFAIQTGQAACNGIFANTFLGDDIRSKSLTLTCNSRYVTSNTYIPYTVHASINTYIHTYIHTYIRSSEENVFIVVIISSIFPIFYVAYYVVHKF